MGFMLGRDNKMGEFTPASEGMRERISTENSQLGMKRRYQAGGGNGCTSVAFNSVEQRSISHTLSSRIAAAGN